MTRRNIILLFLLLLTRTTCNGQEMDFEKNLKIVNADYGTCYTIGNYMLCPEQKTIRVGHMFGTATKDLFGYFPDSTLKYDEVTLIIFGGEVFFDNLNWDIDWNTAKLLSYGDYYTVFTDGKILYQVKNGHIGTSKQPYNINTYKPFIKNSPEYKKNDELSEGFSIHDSTFYFKNIPILEPFDVANLRTIISESGFESNYITDGKCVIFGGGKGGYSSTKKDGQEYVLAKRWMIEGVDLPSVRVLGRDLISDKNALYYRKNIIPFDKLNGLKLIIREL